MDGIAGATARVAQIQALVQSVQRAPVGVSVQRAGAVAGLGTSGATATGAASGAAFQQALTQATGARSTGAPGSTAVDSEGVPLDLKAYGNGKIPASALKEIGVGQHTLWAPAADAFAKMQAAAKADGITFGVTDSYRSYEAQVDVARRKGLYKNGGLAAVPGTSQHGWGMALDLKLDSKAQAWMRANAERFGFDESTPREPWHWSFTP
ncbi:M15 family metallopeptidase [Aquipuribacter hungaricus]|uniref:D-alanyl-D-alanine carboxypeptidase family protein n=1 Tax=Aquipuribacter hungaricus TaxID=545624 RepID=A0ABV7WJ66_9MICO